MSSTDHPMSCFRCYDMKVIDPFVLESIKNTLRESYEMIESTKGQEDLLDKINRHIIVIESMPDE